ncbi:MAG: WYL domain-containing protein [Candidatus Omnitrophica bacterium]|nr:WYL domain-containing protein [Candidatus Omnitrophota bacterium]
MHRSIEEIEFTIFDTETTGLSPEDGDRIVELAALRFRGNKRLATFSTLVNPQRAISEAAFAVNKITPEMLRSAPGIKEVMPGFLDFIKGSCLCSYNAPFDLKFIDSELALMGRKPLEDIIVVDALKMARRLLASQERYALWFVAEKLGVTGRQEHRALSDVEITLEVFSRLKEIFLLKNIGDFSVFVSLFAINPHIVDNLNAQKISQIQEAIDLGVKLRIKYLTSSGGAVSEREVEPKGIKIENRRHYLVGYCHLRNEERTFRIDGILHLEII